MAEDDDTFDDDDLLEDDDYDYSDDNFLGGDDFDKAMSQTPKQRLEDYLEQRELKKRLDYY